MHPSSLWQHDYTLCREGLPSLIGVDEAGRGALAGPVMAAAVFLEVTFFESTEAQSEATAINDSKQLSAVDREAQHALILGWRERGLIRCAWAAGSVEEIERLNILGATRLAMQRSLEALEVALPSVSNDLPLFQPSPENHSTSTILVDGRPLKPFPYCHRGMVKGDGTSLCVAAASILAKVERDRLMSALCQQHAAYGFSRHKGYGTAEHRHALARHGACPEHRSLFLRKIPHSG